MMAADAQDGETPREAKLQWLSDLVAPLIADNDATIEAVKSGQARGPSTGIITLDKALGGRLETGLHILQATPGAGKTGPALQIASDCQFPALYVSAEMPTLELFRRLIARQTSTFLSKLKGELSSPDVRRLALSTVEKLSHLAVMNATVGLANVDLIRQTV